MAEVVEQLRQYMEENNIPEAGGKAGKAGQGSQGAKTNGGQANGTGAGCACCIS